MLIKDRATHTKASYCNGAPMQARATHAGQGGHQRWGSHFGDANEKQLQGGEEEEAGQKVGVLVGLVVDVRAQEQGRRDDGHNGDLQPPHGQIQRQRYAQAPLEPCILIISLLTELDV